MIFLIIALIAGAFFVSVEYGWRGGLFYTLSVGFLQDPIRKLVLLGSSNSTGTTYYGGIAFACFIITFIALRNTSQFWYTSYIFWTNKKLRSLMIIFIYLLGLQTLNSLARSSGDFRVPVIGLLFYTIPLLALWVGFHLGNNMQFLKNVIGFYILCCSIVAITVLLDSLGIQNPLFNEVGKGLLITGLGEGGTAVSGSSGLWRTSEIAGWHLAAGACFSFILGMTSSSNRQQNGWFLLSLGLTYLANTTGRRKALGLIIVFVSLFLLYYSFSSQKGRLFRTVSSIFLVLLISIGSFGLIFNDDTQESLEKFENRTKTLSLELSQERFTSGIDRVRRGIEIGGPFGCGVGVGTNTGDTGINRTVCGESGLGYATEAGGGRIVTELGIVGTIFFLYLIFEVGVLYYKNYQIGISEIPADNFNILVGLLMFVVANLVSFFQAGQVYSDLYILMLIGIFSGTFLAVPLLAAKFHTLKPSNKPTR
jgi:hypothetical protein